MTVEINLLEMVGKMVLVVENKFQNICSIS